MVGIRATVSGHGDAGGGGKGEGFGPAAEGVEVGAGGRVRKGAEKERGLVVGSWREGGGGGGCGGRGGDGGGARRADWPAVERERRGGGKGGADGERESKDHLPYLSLSLRSSNRSSERCLPVWHSKTWHTSRVVLLLVIFKLYTV